MDRSFEEVCSIMDRTGDTAELLVEHATDFRMCDLLDDNNIQQSLSNTSNSNQRNINEVAGLVVSGKIGFLYFYYIAYM